jgi:hypothetical protein
VLTTATHYWNDTREFNLYFVETLRREDYGDKKTSLLLKGLDLVCRYHFMFLEDERLSEAIAQLEKATRPHNSVLIKAMANKLLDIIPATGREV